MMSVTCPARSLAESVSHLVVFPRQLLHKCSLWAVDCVPVTVGPNTIITLLTSTGGLSSVEGVPGKPPHDSKGGVPYSLGRTT